MSEPLLDETLKKWRGKKIALAVNSEHSFIGILKDFDEESILLENVTDVVGNKGKELLVKIDDVSWIMLMGD
ncbi:hypothetical protein E3E31_08835 [Thermococcus sp. M39]|uniref:LSm family protein n=1 Tax=unclassified Thermococcus TaxID=2627626 RepID=UPI001438913A|nr:MULTISPECIES: LSm family protein [unclassified Thermococcus]NJE08622.1 hypothetical protein [Thermococcus sp. M39]NJE13230.1 hypothetical protein [Thermococcus sp. LS2]